MLPILMLISVGRVRRFWLPLPIILLWPLWLSGWIVWLVMRAVGSSHEKILRMALMMSAQLSGTIIEVDSEDDDSKFHLRMI